MISRGTVSMAACVAVCGMAGGLHADELALGVSYEGNEIRLYASPLAYEVLKDGQTMVAKTAIGMNYDGVACDGAKPVSKETKSLSGTVATPVYKKGSVDLSGNEGYVDFGDFGIRLVARRDGVGYRFETKKPVTVVSEAASLTIPSKDARCWFNRTPANAWGCEETVPEFADAGKLPADAGKMYYLPFVYSVNGKTVAVTESDVNDYPVWNFKNIEQTAEGTRLDAEMERYPKKSVRLGGGWGKNKEMETGGRWIGVKEHDDFLVKTTGPKAFPWRTFILADKPAKLAEADIVFALASPQDEGADYSWVKPGKVAWDWWNCFDNIGDPEGCTTKTYERFIDFAAKTGVEYVIFDEGWSAALDIWKYSPVVDVPHLIKYAEKKGVGIILWMAWAQIYGEEERVAEHFAKLGAKGFKVDFMDRGDARVGQFLVDFAKACAKHKMLIDYHGTYRPNGLHRRFPNILNYEGIHGLEQMKWAKPDKDMAHNDVACCFLRMTAGPMDYTPGAMLNQPYGKYSAGEKAHFPGSVGTRCHQMAMMAAYEAPLQMLSDSPTNYEKNMECFDFMSKVPVVWDDTIGVSGCPESMAVLARKAKDGSWYVAGLNNKTPKAATFKLCFLKEGEWTAEIFRDTADGDVAPQKYIHETRTVKACQELSFDMSVGGGFVVKFVRR